MYEFQCSNRVQTAATAHKRGQSINFASIINTTEVWKAIYSTCIIHFFCRKCKCIIHLWTARVGPPLEPCKRESGSRTTTALGESVSGLVNSPRQILRLSDSLSQTKHWLVASRSKWPTRVLWWWSGYPATFNRNHSETNALFPPRILIRAYLFTYLAHDWLP